MTKSLTNLAEDYYGNDYPEDGSDDDDLDGGIHYDHEHSSGEEGTNDDAARTSDDSMGS